MGTHATDTPAVPPEEALRRLREGNGRFLRGVSHLPRIQKEVLSDLAKGQRPYATILCCSDSRVPPELIFDAGFGELFIVRVAGNVLSEGVAGSLQYAGTHLKTLLVVVLGHEDCGGVQAALQTKLHGTAYRSRIQFLVDHIVPALSPPDPGLPPQEQLSRAVEENVRWTMRQILESPEGRARRKEGRMRLAGAIFEIETGRVRFLD
jgi:carbonic anhydrase